MQPSLKPLRYTFFISSPLFLPLHTGKEFCLRITLMIFLLFIQANFKKKKIKRKGKNLTFIFFKEEVKYFLQRHRKTLKTLEP